MTDPGPKDQVATAVGIIADLLPTLLLHTPFRQKEMFNAYVHGDDSGLYGDEKRALDFLADYMRQDPSACINDWTAQLVYRTRLEARPMARLPENRLDKA